MKLSNLTKTHQIVLTALMAALNVIFALIATYFIGLGLLIMLFLPLASVIVALNVNLKYYPVYFVATMSLALIVNFASIENTLFFLLPVLLSGLAFGSAIRFNLNDIYIIALVTLVNFATSLMTIPFINIIYDINFIEVFIRAIGFRDLVLGNHLFPTILMVFASIQTLITFFVIQNDGHYFDVQINTTFDRKSTIVSFLTLLIAVVLMFINEGLALSVLFFATLFSVYLLFNLVVKFKIVGIITAFSAVLLGLISVSLFETFTSLSFYFGFLVPLFLIVIVAFLWLYINITKKEITKNG